MSHDRAGFENLLVEQEKERNGFINRAWSDAIRDEKIRNAGGEEELSLLEFKELQKSEKEKLDKFFGYTVEVPNLPGEITAERYVKWKKMGFELHYLPKEKMSKERNLPGWDKKPNNLFEYIKEGKVESGAIELAGQWVLIDERIKPDYDVGDQVYKDDPLSGAIKELRERKVLSDFKIMDSRFSISSEDFKKDEVRKTFANVLGVNPDNVRLPRAIEFNFIGNAHYPEWGHTTTWECFDDKHDGGSRLHGGNKDRGGLSDINHLSSSDDRRPPGGFRLIISF